MNTININSIENKCELSLPCEMLFLWARTDLSISVTYSKAFPDRCLISSRRQFETELQKDSDICNAGALMCSLQYNSHSSEDFLVNSQNTAENSTL